MQSKAEMKLILVEHAKAVGVIYEAILELLPCMPEYARKVALAIPARLAACDPPLLIQSAVPDQELCPICHYQNREPDRSLCRTCIQKGFDRATA